jgi:menaquinone-dependent protoporphyrinogen oxidase
MKVLVAYASRYGATQGIAERIGEELTQAGVDAEVRAVRSVSGVDGYDAFVVGSALYMAHWEKDGLTFVRRNAAALAAKPVWLFSSGPVGTGSTDANGRDVRANAGPQELAEITAATHPRDHHVFFGALTLSKLRGMHRALAKLPAARKLFIEGDFRDWDEIASWTRVIAADLAETRAAATPAPA